MELPGRAWFYLYYRSDLYATALLWSVCCLVDETKQSLEGQAERDRADAQYTLSGLECGCSAVRL